MEIFFVMLQFIFLQIAFLSIIILNGRQNGIVIRLQRPFYGFVNGDSDLSSQIVCLNLYKLWPWWYYINVLFSVIFV